MSWKRSSQRKLDFGKNSTPETIGPGSYEVETGSSRLSIRIKGAKSQRTPFETPIQHFPAPGDYDPQPTSSARRVSSSFKSRTPREVFKPSDNPSPAEHSNIAVWKKEKKRPESARTVRERPPSANFGQGVSSYQVGEDGRIVAIKEPKRGPEWVGPGSYTIRDAGSSKGHRMKESYRNTDFRVNSTPGPGEYESRGSSSRCASHIYDRRPEAPSAPPKSGNLTHTEWRVSETPSSVFSSRSNRDLFGVREDTPGPGDYEYKLNKRGKTASSFGTRSARFTDRKDDTPGPGAYNVTSTNWKPKKVAYGRRENRKLDASTDVPGPGQYSDSSQWVKSNRPSSAFRSGSVRNFAHSDDLPGPGEYSPSLSRGKGVSIHASRFQNHNNFLKTPTEDTPSPDAYVAVAPKQTKVIKISETDRFAHEKRPKTPGPGQYDSGHQSLLKRSYNIDCVSSMRTLT